MSIDQPLPPTEYEPAIIEPPKDSFVDRFLIGIGDLVIRNFTFLVFITVIWGIFILIFFGGVVLIYSVAESFRDLEGREQQRQILYEQQIEQLVPSEPLEITEASDWDDSAWFGDLNEMVGLASVEEPILSLDAGIKLTDSPLSLDSEKGLSTFNRQLVVNDHVWQVACGNAGFVYDGSYPCPITNVSLLDAEDPAASN
ncbi:MAG: hypothetical protein AB8G95_10965 [Anaerolineae bacterium]